MAQGNWPIGSEIRISRNWRIACLGNQWAIQQKRGKIRTKGTGWQAVAWFTQRNNLMDRVAELPEGCDPQAFAMLAGLPETHPGWRASINEAIAENQRRERFIAGESTAARPA